MFARTLDVSDWERFGRYARRVRALHFDEHGTKTLVAREAFDEISRTRVSLNILPNLRRLTWVATNIERMRLSLMFQHENIHDFAVYVHRSPAYPISTFFKEVMLRMPRLKNLDLRFHFPAREAEADLVDLFLGLPGLKKVIMPLYTLTTAVVEKLSELKELETVQFEFQDSQGRGIIEDVAHFDPQLREGSFPALADISLSIRLPDVTRFLCGSFAPVNLTSLYIHVLSASSVDNVHEFLTAVTENCQLLRRLYLDFFTSVDIRSDPELPALTWQTLRPVMYCANLVEFEVRWDKPFDLTQADVEELAAKWPSIETLMLNCEPMHVASAPALDLRALVPFARHCPQLSELGLYLNGDAALRDAGGGGGGSSATLPVPQPFASLTRLCLGNSPLGASGSAALFLSQLCPLGCEVIAGVTWPDGFAIRDDVVDEETLVRLNTQATVWFDGWKEVNRTLPLLTSLRIEERERRAAMERDLLELQAKARTWAEQADMVPVDTRRDGMCVIA
ncbi:uncharacterized protein PHACADRAFT_262746 [Phanerochaete carnosa HHB-10118-sp]|uniref:F-box domain-containing protein n=1 Tax=Phanerochaete carnosa (strain HHB-10118-sp) TaxID=650164 RepID=K5VWA5_PHACS|nr:uncharacterized protein PHACADRAFT_262746 [Phanerochaete carnosa HHB-10118-sp]EKM50864.1 hypothetical protein PHACADRAFT_262746 [Phanerochaete carnosa HHB-10118-sp]